jgi:hypothetical protein
MQVAKQIFESRYSDYCSLVQQGLSSTILNHSASSNAPKAGLSGAVAFSDLPPAQLIAVVAASPALHSSLIHPPDRPWNEHAEMENVAHTQEMSCRNHNPDLQSDTSSSSTTNSYMFMDMEDD